MLVQFAICMIAYAIIKIWSFLRYWMGFTCIISFRSTLNIQNACTCTVLGYNVNVFIFFVSDSVT